MEKIKQILIIKTGSMPEEDKKHCSENGIIVIENENPETVRVVTPMEGFEGNDVLESLIEAINASVGVSFVKEEFFRKLTKRITDKIKK